MSGQRAVITGAGSGLGRALSLALAKRGGRVLVSDIDEASAEETAGLVRAADTGAPLANVGLSIHTTDDRFVSGFGRSRVLAK